MAEERPASDPSVPAAFFEHCSDLLALLDADGRIQRLSTSLAEALGYGPGAITGRRALNFVHPAHREKVKARRRTLSDDRPVSGLHAPLLRSDGSTLFARWTLCLGGDGRVYATGRELPAEGGVEESPRAGERAELRLRTALELHDGVLQALTGANLKIAVARRLLSRDPPGAEEMLAELADILSAEQREIRLYVDEIKGEFARSETDTSEFEERISAMLERVQVIWGVDTSLETDLDGAFSSEMIRRVLRIIQEATVNAARHGSAESVSVRVTNEEDEVEIRIVDDGDGFPFLGEYDTDELRDRRLGPVSLKHRIAEVDGRISLRSTRRGSTLFIRVPARRGSDR